MNDKSRAIEALAQIIRTYEEKGRENPKLKKWFITVSKNLNSAVKDLEKGA